MSNNSDNVSLATWVVISVMEVMGIVSLVWVINFYRLRSLKEISSRRARSSILAGVINSVGLIIVYPLVLITLNIKYIPYIPYIPTLNNLGIMICSTGVYHVFTYRAWMVYFHIKFNKSLQNKKWRLYIDPQEPNWFLKHKRSWGNKKRIAIILFSNWCTWAVLGTFICILNGGLTTKISRTVVLISGLGPFFFDIVIYFKFPKFFDIFGVHDEIKMTLRIELLQMIIYYPLAVIVNAQYYSFEYICMISVGAVFGFIFVLVMQYRVFKISGLPSLPYYPKRYLIDRLRMDDMMNTDYNLSAPVQRLASASVGTVNGAVQFRIKIRHILEDKHGFDEFALHLTKEFCLENLLFFVETHQWIAALKAKNSYSDFETDRTMTIKFPESAPKSRIIQSNDNPIGIGMDGIIMDNNGNVVSTIKHHVSDQSQQSRYDDQKDNELPTTNEYLQCVRLFKKYVPDSAYFGINIGSRTRTTLYDEVGYDVSSQKDANEMIQILKKEKKMNRATLFHLFDDARGEIYRLLNHAFSRFRRTDIYDKVVETITIKDPPHRPRHHISTTMMSTTVVSTTIPSNISVDGVDSIYNQ